MKNLIVISLCAVMVGCDHPKIGPLEPVPASQSIPVVAKVIQPAVSAIQELKDNAQGGDARAQYLLGLRYGKGDGVAVDNELAAQWLTMAAEQHLPEAFYALGGMYEFGTGVAVNLPHALKLYEYSAYLGLPAGQVASGTLFWRLGDKAQAWAWLAIADDASAEKWMQELVPLMSHKEKLQGEMLKSAIQSGVSKFHRLHAVKGGSKE